MRTPFNILNRCPVVNVPTGLAAGNGVPMQDDTGSGHSTQDGSLAASRY